MHLNFRLAELSTTPEHAKMKQVQKILELTCELNTFTGNIVIVIQQIYTIFLDNSFLSI